MLSNRVDCCLQFCCAALSRLCDSCVFCVLQNIVIDKPLSHALNMAPKRRRGFGLSVHHSGVISHSDRITKGGKGIAKGSPGHHQVHQDDYGNPFIIVDADDYGEEITDRNGVISHSDRITNGGKDIAKGLSGHHQVHQDDYGIIVDADDYGEVIDEQHLEDDSKGIAKDIAKFKAAPVRKTWPKAHWQDRACIANKHCRGGKSSKSKGKRIDNLMMAKNLMIARLQAGYKPDWLAGSVINDVINGIDAIDNVIDNEDEDEEVVPWAERQQQRGITMGTASRSDGGMSRRRGRAVTSTSMSNVANLSKAAWRRKASVTSAASANWKDSGGKTKTHGGIQFVNEDRRRLETNAGSFVVVDEHGIALDVNTGMRSMIVDGHIMMIGNHSTGNLIQNQKESLLKDNFSSPQDDIVNGDDVVEIQ